MKTYKIVCVLACLLSSVMFHPTAFADEASDARTAADTIIDLLGDGSYGKLWDSHTSNLFKSAMTRDSFIANMKFGRQSIGKRASKKLVDQGHTDGDPSTGYKGDVYVFNYRNVYDSGTMFERVVVIKEDGNEFKMSGIWGQPEKQP
jgi:hypothetical protein